MIDPQDSIEKLKHDFEMESLNYAVEVFDEHQEHFAHLVDEIKGEAIDDLSADWHFECSDLYPKVEKLNSRFLDFSAHLKLMVDHGDVWTNNPAKVERAGEALKLVREVFKDLLNIGPLERVLSFLKIQTVLELGIYSDMADSSTASIPDMISDDRRRLVTESDTMRLPENISGMSIQPPAQSGSLLTLGAGGIALGFIMAGAIYLARRFGRMMHSKPNQSNENEEDSV